MFREGLRPPNPFRESDPLDMRTQDGMSVRALSELGPLLVICLPEWKTSACRKWIRATAAARPDVERAGARLALVHVGSEEDARGALDPLDLGYVARVADPQRVLYGEFGLEEASRWFGDARQLPGVFLLENGKVSGEFRPRAAGQRPELLSLLASDPETGRA